MNKDTTYDTITSNHFAIATATAHEIEVYLAKKEDVFRAMNERCVNAGRKPQFDDTKLAARIYDLIPISDGKYKIERRVNPIVAIDDDRDGVIALLSRSPSERNGEQVMRGKYNDGAQLMDQQADYTIGEANEFLHDDN